MLVVQIHQDVAVRPVTGQQNEDDEIRNQQRDVEGIRVIDPTKGGIQKMLADVGPNPLGPCQVSEMRS